MTESHQSFNMLNLAKAHNIIINVVIVVSVNISFVGTAIFVLNAILATLPAKCVEMSSTFRCCRNLDGIGA